MNVYTDIKSLPVFTKAVITTGSFDGVHVGHEKIISQLINEAKRIGGTPVLITFYPHPKQIVQIKDKPLFVLNTPEEKYELLQKMGIKNIVVVPFDKQFSELTASQYIEDFLVKNFNPSLIVVGYDHRFGHNREGNFDLLKAEGTKNNYEVIEIPEHILKDITISSTKIRNALTSGDINTAALHLGYQYFFTGTVIEGNKLGRTIGYPTANLLIENENKLIPADGVYAVDVILKDSQLKGMMNIGMRPTVAGKKRTIEVNIFNFNEDIYGEYLKITIKNHLRSEVKFNGLDKLKAQLARDKEMAVGLNS
ncbi:MAG: bifunctional riboflavin kinase/FAD synthetase [Ferruginibacter sp.]